MTKKQNEVRVVSAQVKLTSALEAAETLLEAANTIHDDIKEALGELEYDIDSDGPPEFPVSSIDVENALSEAAGAVLDVREAL